MTKTSAKAAALMSVAAMLLVGCGTSDGKPASAESTGGASATVSITHAWGTDDYPVKPETVVALGTSVDNLLALGITPTAVIETPYDKDAPWRGSVR